MKTARTRRGLVLVMLLTLPIGGAARRRSTPPLVR